MGTSAYTINKGITKPVEFWRPEGAVYLVSRRRPDCIADTVCHTVYLWCQHVCLPRHHYHFGYCFIYVRV